MSVCAKRNPFTNYPIIDSQNFIGRERDLEIILESIYKASNRDCTNILFIEGDKGVGKTSLINQVACIAEGNRYITSKLDNTLIGFYFLVGRSDTFSYNNSISDVIVSLFENLKDKLTFMQKLMLRQYKISVKLNYEQIEVAVESINRLNEIPRSIFNEFYDALKKLNEIILTDRTGMILIFDDMDKIIDECNYGDFFKTLVEKFQHDNLTNFLIILAGSPNSLYQLYNQESALINIIEPIHIKEFSKQEGSNLLHAAFKKENILIDDDVIDAIYSFTNGYPDLIQQIGSKIYQVDKDNHIDIDDFTEGKNQIMNAREEIIRVNLKKTDFNHKKILKALNSSKNKISINTLRKFFSSELQLTSCIDYLVKLGFIIVEGDFCKFKNSIVKNCFQNINVK